jgi:hypothetical protein
MAGPFGRPEDTIEVLRVGVPHRPLIVAKEVERVLGLIVPRQRPCPLKKGHRLGNAELGDSGDDCL